MTESSSSLSSGVSFIHISDSHLGPDNSYIQFRHGAWACARDVVRSINELPTKVDFVIHSGDVAGRPSPDTYRLAEETFSAIQAPVYYTVGNHDSARDMRDILNFGPCTFLSESPELLTYRFEIGAERFLVIDAKAPDASGLMGEEQLAIVQNEIAELVAKPASSLSIFVHYQPIPLGHRVTDENIMLKNGELLHNGLAQVREQIRGVFHGHLHMPQAEYRDGILYSCVSSIFSNFVIWPGGERLERTQETPGYAYVRLGDAGTVVRHFTIPRSVDGEYKDYGGE